MKKVTSMKWENNELVIILSQRKGKLLADQICIFCKQKLPKESTIKSFGTVDRKTGLKERWYTCEEHENIFNYNSVEDCPEYLQRYLLENRLANEVWFKE